MCENRPIIVEQNFDVPISIVWDAISQVDQMKQWFFENIESFKPEVGFETQFNVQAESRDFMHIWKIIEVVQSKKIVYEWKYENIPGEANVIFELFVQGQETMLRLTNFGLESFPQDIPEFSRESGVNGWKYFIQDRLKEFLNS